jgi:hypothetical protein
MGGKNREIGGKIERWVESKEDKSKVREMEG